MIGGQMNPELMLHSANDDVTLIAYIIKPLVIVGPSREDVAVSARRCPFRTVEKQDGVRLEFRVGPGVMCDVTLNMVVMVGNTEIVHSHGFSKGDDLGLWVIAGVFAVPGVQVKVTL